MQVDHVETNGPYNSVYDCDWVILFKQTIVIIYSLHFFSNHVFCLSWIPKQTKIAIAFYLNTIAVFSKCRSSHKNSQKKKKNQNSFFILKFLIFIFF